jgi:hypothetical protein
MSDRAYTAFHLQAQRLLAAGQIDQEVDIENGCATKKHKVRCSLV